jgi:serine/threonine protein kinase
MSDPSSERDPVEALAEEFVERHRRGERPSLSEYAAKHPDLADDIRELFPALVKMEQLRPQRGDTPDFGRGDGAAAVLKLERLGAYRILREIGRGGMGVVYEAEQEALGRRVALKVLLGPAAQDAKVLARFRRESRTAAQLHHTNIVPVFDVGQQGDLCYSAMQCIRGQALDPAVPHRSAHSQASRPSRQRSLQPRRQTPG